MNIRMTFFVGMIFMMDCCLVASCDVIERNEGYTEPYQPPVEMNGRKVLLEEYTGMRCVNCPAAAEEASLLKETFGESLVVVAIHAGSFASPSGIFQPDLRTEAGNSYFSHFSFVGTPLGMVNRKNYGGMIPLRTGVWADAIRSALTTSSDARVEGSIVYKKEERSFQCGIEVSGMLPGEEANLTLWLVEDNIITPQVIPGGVNPEYTQRHVLRKALNGTWGEQIVPKQNGEWEGSRSYQLPEDMVAEQCSLVAFITLPSQEEVVAVVNIPFIVVP